MNIIDRALKVRVVDIDDEEDGDCSDEFYLMASDEVTTEVSEDYFLTVTSPEEGDVAVAGDEYTVEVREHNTSFASSFLGLGSVPRVNTGAQWKT